MNALTLASEPPSIVLQGSIFSVHVSLHKHLTNSAHAAPAGPLRFASKSRREKVLLSESGFDVAVLQVYTC